MTAYHEAGHALLSLLMDEVDTFTKVSIIPRGMAGGYTLTPPQKTSIICLKKIKGHDDGIIRWNGREEIYMGDTTTGVSNDLQRVSQIARSMVCTYGMSDKLDKLAFGKQNQQMFLGRDLLKKKLQRRNARKIDEEVHNLVHERTRAPRNLI